MWSELITLNSSPPLAIINFYHIYSLLFLISLDTFEKNSYVAGVQGCSIFFQPDFKWKKAICDSESSRLSHIPLDFPTNLIHLQIKHQQIHLLTNQGLSRLINLENLHIESSHLTRITFDAFRSLGKLKYLHLRNNSLQLGQNGLPKEALKDLPHLELLDLTENPIYQIPDAFFSISGGSQLKNLRLGHTKAHALKIEPDAFVDLAKLEVLDMSYSKLTTMSSTIGKSFEKMSRLSTIYLGGNPWHCDCKLRWLPIWMMDITATSMDYVQEQTSITGEIIDIEPLCSSPPRLRNRRLLDKTLSHMDFRCAPRMLAIHQNFTVTEGELSTITCEYYADPKVPVIWYRNGEKLINSTIFRMNLLHTGDTIISTLRAKFSKADESSKWFCVIDDSTSDVRNTTFLLHVVPNKSYSFLRGMSVTQQSWIYAGVGSGLLLLVITGVGVGIFYCCDPRTNIEQPDQRAVHKSQVRRLQSCYGCPPLPPTHRSNIFFRNKLVKNNGMIERHRSNSPILNNESPLRQLNPTITSSEARSKISSNQPTVSLFNPDEGDKRLLVSCDGPEPKVLLTSKLNLPHHIDSPSSIYGFSDEVEHSSPSKTTEKLILAHPFANRILTGSNSQHVYAQLNRTNSVQIGNRIPSISNSISKPSQTYSILPCPVHGNIPIDQVHLPYIPSPSASADTKRVSELIASAPINITRPLKHVCESDESEKTPFNVLIRQIPEKIHSASSTEVSCDTNAHKSNEKHGISKSNISDRSQTGTRTKYITPDLFRYSSHDDDQNFSKPIFYDRTDFQVARYEIKSANPPRRSSSALYRSTNSLKRHLDEEEDEENDNYANKPAVDLVSSMDESWKSTPNASSSDSESNLTRSHIRRIFHHPPVFGHRNKSYQSYSSPSRRSLRGDDRRSWYHGNCSQLQRGCVSQMISPTSDYARSRNYRMISTLPTRLRKPSHTSRVSFALVHGSCRRNNSLPKIRPLLRAGSKHKLDTDSGSDHNVQ